MLSRNSIGRNASLKKKDDPSGRRTKGFRNTRVGVRGQPGYSGGGGKGPSPKGEKKEGELKNEGGVNMFKRGTG